MGKGANKGVFKQIFKEHWARFNKEHPKYKTKYYDEVINKMLGCCNSENGFMSYVCLECGEEKRVPFSCKSSFCLSCAKIYTDEWVEYIGQTLFKGMRYRHLVLTIPECLRIWFYRKPELLDELMKEGHKFFEDVVSFWLKSPVDVGCIVVLQTAGRSGKYNVHLHIICTSGGITEERKWKGFGFIEFSILHKKWQYHLLKMLKAKIKSVEMKKDIDRCWKEYPNGFVAYIEKGDVPAGGQGLAQYLAKYVVSPPISLKRIIKYDGERVRYWYNDHTTGKREEEEVDVLTFIGRMVQHILPKGFQRIRYYGIQSTCRASKIREELKGLLSEWNSLGNDSDKGIRDTYKVTGYRERIRKSFGKDPLICTRCGNKMEFKGIWHPKYGWIVNNWGRFFAGEMEIGENEKEEGKPGVALQHSKSILQLQMPFMRQ